MSQKKALIQLFLVIMIVCLCCLQIACSSNKESFNTENSITKVILTETPTTEMPISTMLPTAKATETPILTVSSTKEHEIPKVSSTKQPSTETTGTKDAHESSEKAETKNSNVTIQDSDTKSDFKEINETEELVKAIGFNAVKYYQSNDVIYLLIYSGLKNSEKALEMRNYYDPPCSEVWTYDLSTENLTKLFVKYDYDFGNNREGNMYNYPSGKIQSIDNVDSYGNIFFTESWNEGMEHYGTRKFEYISSDNKIITLSFEAGRIDDNSMQESEKILKEVFTKEILSIFYKISLIIDKDKGKSSFDSFTNDLLYAVQYNLQKEDGTYYHEIDQYDIQTGIKTPIIQKILNQKDEDPFIFVDIDENENITISDWCGLNTPLKSNQKYTYKPIERTIKLESGTDETGKYVIYNKE